MGCLGACNNVEIQWVPYILVLTETSFEQLSSTISQESWIDGVLIWTPPEIRCQPLLEGVGTPNLDCGDHLFPCLRHLSPNF
jgi:hypothetical protein